MRTLLVCPKKSGNTFKVCDYVLKHADLDLKILNSEEVCPLKNYDTIILASGIYMGKAHINIKKWLDQINKDQLTHNTKFYLLMTWFGRGRSDQTAMEQLNLDLKRIAASLEENYMTCFGQGMGLIRIGHPDVKELKKVLDWVNDLKCLK